MVKSLQPDLDVAARFLAALDGIPDQFTFQTFSDKKDKGAKFDPLAKVFHGELRVHAKALKELQCQGAGVFVMVNRGDGVIHPGKATCRNEANVLAVRALFADLDGAPLEPVLTELQPDIVVESSRDRWHAYWVVDGCPLNEFKLRQVQIAAKFGSDPAVKDLPRVMRLPGFFHQKGEPFMTRLVYPE